MRACALKPSDPHTDPAVRAATCLLCWKALHSPDSREREKLGGDPEVRIPTNVPKPLPPGLTPARPARSTRRPAAAGVQVRYCSSRDVWEWGLYVGGRRVDHGYDPDEGPAREAAAAALAKHGPVRLDENTLAPEVPGRRLNPGLLPWGDGYLFAFRSSWADADIYLTQLDREFRPTGPPAKLDLYHPTEAPDGREDPRLFLFRGRVHVAYAGLNRAAGRVSVLYAPLTQDLRVVRVYCPDYAQRAEHEKNWSFFEGPDGNLYAVYSFRPHRVLRIDGDRAELAYGTATPDCWRFGEARGGAPPVRVGDEWWSFFHSHTADADGRAYVAGLYTFDADPPHAVRRVVPEPILSADRGTRTDGSGPAVVFPAGAVRVGGDWVVACGIHDHWSELHRFSHADLAGKLVPVGSVRRTAPAKSMMGAQPQEIAT